MSHTSTHNANYTYVICDVLIRKNVKKKKNLCAYITTGYYYFCFCILLSLFVHAVIFSKYEFFVLFFVAD